MLLVTYDQGTRSGKEFREWGRSMETGIRREKSSVRLGIARGQRL